MGNSVNTLIFTKTEEKVVNLLARGYSEKEIAEKLFVSPHTIDNHLRNMRKKNNVNKNTELILLYIIYLSKKKFSLKDVKNFGVSILFLIINVCGYNQTL